MSIQKCLLQRGTLLQLLQQEKTRHLQQLKLLQRHQHLHLHLQLRRR